MCRDPVQMVGFSRPSGEFGGKSGANSTAHRSFMRKVRLLGGCRGILVSHTALLDKMGAAWISNDVAAAKEVYTADAVVVWPAGSDPAVSSGIDAITKLVADYPIDPTRIGDETFTYVPSAKDIEALSVAYDGARYVAYPVRVGRDLYLSVIEIRDGKVANQWVSYMYRPTP